MNKENPFGKENIMSYFRHIIFPFLLMILFFTELDYQGYMITGSKIVIVILLIIIISKLDDLKEVVK